MADQAERMGYAVDLRVACRFAGQKIDDFSDRGGRERENASISGHEALLSNLIVGSASRC
jgi:hypothetical protein